jgi:hypothetical protein
MKKLLIAFAVAACLPLVAGAQNATDELKPFTAVLTTEGLPLALILVNDKTAPVLFQPPTLYAIRARASQQTTLYVQGMADKSMDFDTSNFTIEQAGSASATGQPTSIHNFTKGKVKLMKGDRIDGLLTFDKMFNMNQPFTVKHGKDMVQVNFGSSTQIR